MTRDDSINPDSPKHVPVATEIAEALPAEILAYLAEASRTRHKGEDRRFASRAFENAMQSLVALDVFRRSEIDDDALAAFWRQAGIALAGLTAQLSAYLTATMANLQRYDWHELSTRRSALQALLEHFPDPPLAALIKEADLRTVDAELRRLGEAEELWPRPAGQVASPLPESHWWWRLPQQPVSVASCDQAIINEFNLYYMASEMPLSNDSFLQQLPERAAESGQRFRAQFHGSAATRLSARLREIATDRHHPLIQKISSNAEAVDWYASDEDLKNLQQLLRAMANAVDDH